MRIPRYLFTIVCYSSHELNNEPTEERTIMDHLNTKLVGYSDPHFIKNLNNKPFNNQTVFNHFNSQLVCYSDLHCIIFAFSLLSFVSHVFLLSPIQFRFFPFFLSFLCSTLFFQRLDSNIESKSSNNTYLNIIE